MAFNPFDFIKNNPFQEDIFKDKDLVEGFFGENNPFDQQFFDRVFKNGKVMGEDANFDKRFSRSVPMDIVQKPYEMLFIFEIPGIKKNDLQIKIAGSRLTVEGEVRSNYDFSEKEIIKSERKLGNFSRSVMIPVVFDSKRIYARYQNGLLEIRVPILKTNRTDIVNVQFVHDEK
ncbi:Hsp20/alpha crystallin family protein [Tepidibacillus infernus]|uniref:Hsp20/alpha crystallin family protein n=1 Tax=Tepidibacillus infernus TaxID=1806172 RepID=UPI003B6F310F